MIEVRHTRFLKSNKCPFYKTRIKLECLLLYIRFMDWVKSDNIIGLKK